MSLKFAMLVMSQHACTRIMLIAVTIELEGNDEIS